jgi:hypothetical protein
VVFCHFFDFFGIVQQLHLGSSLFHFRERFYEGSISIWETEKAVGPVVQLGKTSPSRGEDRRFKSGSAHFFRCAFVVLAYKKVY